VLRQSTRFDAYRSALSELNRLGLLYRCFCTRKEIAEEIARANEAPHGPEGPLYPGTCRHLTDVERKSRIASGASYALRLDGPKAASAAGPLTFTKHGSTIAVDPLLFGDVVLARKETPVSYHLAVVVDDAFQEVTLVTRGDDLLPATHIQRVLQALLGLPEPAYAHHRLILDSQGRKFSKRDKAVTLRSLREAGQTPGDIRAMIGL
jgi:glutamyl-Q tRNA(Asp) synthetase